MLLSVLLLLSLQILEGVVSQPSSAPATEEGEVNPSTCWLSNCSVIRNTTSTGPLKVYIGGLINKVHDMDIDSQTLKMDVFIWMRWENCTVSSKGRPFTPHKSFILSNAVDRWGLSTMSEANSCEEIPGHAYILLRFEGAFHQKFSFDNYPIDAHRLILTIEEEYSDASELIYVADPVSPASLGIDLRFPGWKISEIIHEAKIIRHKASWGIADYQNLEFSRYSMGFIITRPLSVYLLKILPPILITQFVALGTFLIDIEHYDTRIATATSALLAEIFLQLSFGERLPRGIDYLTLMDVVFNLSYIIICVVIIENIYAKFLFRKIDDYKANKNATGEEAIELKPTVEDKLASEFSSEDEKVMKMYAQVREKIRVMDKYCFIGTSIIGVLCVLIGSLAFITPSTS